MITFATCQIEGLSVFYREAGDPQNPTLIVWGKNDPFFLPEGAYAFQQDLKTLELHLLDSGHFALEEDVHVIAELIGVFSPPTSPNAFFRRISDYGYSFSGGENIPCRLHTKSSPSPEVVHMLKR